jgi:hypothetical protein
LELQDQASSAKNDRLFFISKAHKDLRALLINPTDESNVALKSKSQIADELESRTMFHLDVLRRLCRDLLNLVAEHHRPTELAVAACQLPCPSTPIVAVTPGDSRKRKATPASTQPVKKKLDDSDWSAKADAVLLNYVQASIDDPKVTSYYKPLKNSCEYRRLFAQKTTEQMKVRTILYLGSMRYIQHCILLTTRICVCASVPIQNSQEPPKEATRFRFTTY